MTFTTVRDAAISACRECVQRTRETGWEFGTSITRVGDRFTYRDPITSRSSEFVLLAESYPHDIQKILAQCSQDPKGHGFYMTKDVMEKIRKTIVASCHSHGTEHDLGTRYFSHGDVLQAISVRCRSYLGHSHNGKVYEIDCRTPESLGRTGSEFEVLPAHYRDDDISLELKSYGCPPCLVRGVQIFSGDRP